MRGVLKLSVRAVIWIPCRLCSGRPPAPLGGRLLTNPDDIYQHNMWDHVQWTEEEREKAQRKAEENSKEKIPVEERTKYDKEANKYWDKFYEMHQSKFFRNRSWLFTEFPELLPPEAGGICTPEISQGGGVDMCSESGVLNHDLDGRWQGNTDICEDEYREENQPRCSSNSTSDNNTFPGQHAAFRILEVGCGAGNSVFPIINTIRCRNVFLYCCDFSSRAIELIQNHSDYDPAVCHAFVRDICDPASPFPFPPESLDVILVVFVLSAIHPARILNEAKGLRALAQLFRDVMENSTIAQGVVNFLAGYLKPGGIMLFRDYGRYDLSQLRFKKGQCLSENFYTRQDGTCVYFFTKDEVHRLFSNAGLEEIQNLEDRRLQVNRGKKIVMHRVWMQSKYRKPYLLSASV